LPPPDPTVADLGSYRLLERIGGGGMGSVYRAVHRRIGRPVGIKVLPRTLAGDRTLVNRFFYEARAASLIRHPHVIEVYDFVEGEETFFVMELLTGQDLHGALYGPSAAGQSAVAGPMAPARAVPILAQIASALHAAHLREIIHRDLKPENVFLAEKNGVRDFVKLLDFGVAKLDRPDGQATTNGIVVGTPEYMSPEQARGLSVDARADLYSLGCIAYEMLTGMRPFGGGSARDVLIRQVKVEPPPLRRFASHLDPALEAIVVQALQKDRDLRPSSALEMAQMLSRLGQRPLSSTVPPRRQSRHLHGLAGLRRWPFPRASRRVWQLAGAAAAAVALTSVVLGAQRGAGRTATAGSLRDRGYLEAPARGTADAPEAKVTVRLQSDPSGAEVVDEQGNRLGATPYDLVVRAGSDHRLRFEKPGYRPFEHRFRASLGTTIAVGLDPAPAAAVRGRRNEGPARPRRPFAGTLDPFSEIAGGR
jgi:serine/threonine-protein kinase